MIPAPIALRERDEFLWHPLFAEARSIHVAGQVRSYHPGSFPAGLKGDVGRVMTIGLIITSDAASDESDPATWLTPARLKQGMGSLSGPRRIDDLIARLNHTGHVTLETHPGDGRMRRLRATELLYRWHFEWTRGYFEALQRLFPDPGFDRMLRYDPAFHREFVRSASQTIEVARWVLNGDPKLLAFIAHDQAMLTLNTLLVRNIERPDEPAREAEILPVMRRLGTSRSHFRNVMEIALGNGYVQREGPRGQYLVVTPEWIAASDRFLADSLASNEMNYRHTLERLRVDR